MITLQSVEPLFRETAPVPKELLKTTVIDDFKRNFLTGTLDSQIEVDDSQYDESGGIMVTVISPEAAAGYLAFDDQENYEDWLRQSLYVPTQDEIQEALPSG
jgi:hypothetical protein